MKVLSLERLPYFVQKIKELLPKTVTVDGPGLVPALPQEEGDERVLLGTGEWGEYRGGGGTGAGPMAFEVREDGHLWVVYDDALGEPDLYISEEGHLMWRYTTEEA